MAIPGGTAPPLPAPPSYPRLHRCNERSGNWAGVLYHDRRDWTGFPMNEARHTTRRRRWLTVGLVTGGAVVLAGCGSGSPSSSPTTTKAPAATTPKSATTKPTTSKPTPTTAPTTTTIPFSMAKNARQDVTTDGACTQVNGSWVLKGSVKNSAKTARTFQIVVDFVTQPGDTVKDTKIVTTPSVAPGASRAWSATGAPGLSHLACVIRQVQAPA